MSAHAPLVVKVEAFGFQTDALFDCTAAIGALADLALGVDDTLPRYIGIIDRGHGIADHARGAAADNRRDLSVGGDFACRNLADDGVDAGAQRRGHIRASEMM